MSSVPEVLAALVSLARAALPNSQVIEGPVTGLSGPTSGRMLLVGDEEFDVQRELVALAGSSATEEYVVPCAAVADVLNTPDQYVADAQAWADYEAIEAAVAADPVLGLSASFSLNASITGPRFRRMGDETGRHALVRFGVHVYAANN